MRFSTLTATPFTFQPEGYAVLENRKGPALRRFLIRKMWRWLHNCGALTPYMATEETYEFGRNEEKEIFCRIEHQIFEMIHANQSPENYAIICGAETFHEITRAVVDHHRSFDLSPFQFGHNRYRGEVRGLKLHVVPRMEGIAMVPKVVIEQPRPTP